MVKQEKVSIAIIFKEETPYLFECINHCLELDYDNYEILLFPDGKPKSKLLSYLKKTKKIKVFPTGNYNIPIKRNISVKHSSGKYIAFIDDDAFPRKDWLKNALPCFQNKKIGAVGGPNLTPPKDPLIRRIAGNIMKSKLVFGKGYIRHTFCPKQFLKELPSCNLIVRSSIFDKIKFDEKLAICEDAKLCTDILLEGKKILYDPRVVVFHHRRKIFLPLIKQFLNYGLYKAKMYRRGETRYGYYIIPSFFVLYILIGFLISLLSLTLGKLFGLSMGFYFLIIFINAAKNSKIIEIPLTWITIFLAHVTYGIGFIFGYLSK